MSRERLRVPVLGAPVDVLDWVGALNQIASWAAAGESRTVCCCNVHGVITQRDDPTFAQALQQADMVTPDGAPVAGWLRRSGHPGQPRISGPDLMLRCIDLACTRRLPVFLLGSTESTLQRLRQRLQERWPALVIAGSLAPPFRPLEAGDDDAIVQRVRDSGARLVFVGLGCPKQEIWMARQRGRVPAVLLGVGAAFDFHAGSLRRAPPWMQAAGLEWLHRLLQEPRRLAWRYLSTNTRFMLGAAAHFMARRFSR